MTLDRTRKLQLIQRSLGLRHKLRVHASIPCSENHEELSASLLSKWELQDELEAIEEVLADARRSNVSEKKVQILTQNSPPTQLEMEVRH